LGQGPPGHAGIEVSPRRLRVSKKLEEFSLRAEIRVSTRMFDFRTFSYTTDVERHSCKLESTRETTYCR
jgi:hypothetical protein